MSFHDDTIHYIKGGIETLSAILTKAKDTGHDVSKLLECRIYPDMFPLSFQVWYACDLVCDFTAYFMETEKIDVGTKDDYVVKTFEDCQNIISKARAAIATIDKDKFESRLTDVFNWTIAFSTVSLPGRGYVMSFFMPSFFFHIITAYNIMRKEGVDLGKADYGFHWGLKNAKFDPPFVGLKKNTEA